VPAPTPQVASVQEPPPAKLAPAHTSKKRVTPPVAVAPDLPNPPSHRSTKDKSAYFGLWENEDGNTRNFRKVLITGNEHTVTIREWSPCGSPNRDCYQGEFVGRSKPEGDGLATTIELNFVTRYQELLLDNSGRLRLTTQNKFKDARPDSTLTDVFVHAVALATPPSH
jgi:hypothetical protein